MPAKAPPTKGKPQAQAGQSTSRRGQVQVRRGPPDAAQAGAEEGARAEEGAAPKAKPAPAPAAVAPAPAPAPAPRRAGVVEGPRTLVALFGKEAPALVNTAAGATSGDDVSAALKAARLKATTKAGAVKPAPAAAAAPALHLMQMSALDPRNLDTAITNLRDPGTRERRPGDRPRQR